MAAKLFVLLSKEEHVFKMSNIDFTLSVLDGEGNFSTVWNPQVSVTPWLFSDAYLLHALKRCET